MGKSHASKRKDQIFPDNEPKLHFANKNSDSRQIIFYKVAWINSKKWVDMIACIHFKIYLFATLVVGHENV